MVSTWFLKRNASVRILREQGGVFDTVAEQLIAYLHTMCNITEAAPTCTEVPSIAFSLDPSMPADAYSLSVRDGILHMIGQNGRGLLYAVFGLLERFGCRFYSTDTEIVPHPDALSLPGDLDETAASPFAYRDVYWVGTTDPLTAVKLRINGMGLTSTQHIRHIPEKLGSGIGYAGPHFVHTLQTLIPPENFPDTYFHEHPEYYALIDGERTAKHLYSQPCLTNPDVLRIVVEGVRAWLRANPEARLVSISQIDSFVMESYCTCPDCQKINDEEGSPSGSLIRFVNTVAETLEPEFPNVVFDTLAYQYSICPPRLTKPRHNVAIRMCTSGCASHPIATCPNNEVSANAVRSWAQICDQLYIWDYTTDFAQYMNPYPNFQVLQPNIRFFRDHNVKGVFEQGNYNDGLSGEFGELRAYLLAKLLWNPDLDVDAETEAFLPAYYGGGAPYVRQYLDFIRDKMQDDHLHLFVSAADLWNDRISEEELVFLDKLWADGYQAALDGGDVPCGISAELCAAHVARSGLCHRWFKINAGRGEFSHQDRLDEERTRFYGDCHRMGVTTVGEGTNIPWVDVQ